MAGARNRVQPAIVRRDNEFMGDLALLILAYRSMGRQAEMIHLYYDLGLSMPQIAARLGITKSTVSRTLARGRERLKRYLQYSL